MSYDIDEEVGILIPLTAFYEADSCDLALPQRELKELCAGRDCNELYGLENEIESLLQRLLRTTLSIYIRWDGYGDLVDEEQLFDPEKCYVAFLWSPGDDNRFKRLFRKLEAFGMEYGIHDVSRWKFGG